MRTLERFDVYGAPSLPSYYRTVGMRFARPLSPVSNGGDWDQHQPSFRVIFTVPLSPLSRYSSHLPLLHTNLIGDVC